MRKKYLPRVSYTYEEKLNQFKIDYCFETDTVTVRGGLHAYAQLTETCEILASLKCDYDDDLLQSITNDYLLILEMVDGKFATSTDSSLVINSTPTTSEGN